MRLTGFLQHKRLVGILLRVGLAGVFAYAAISSLLYPDDWVGYLPHAASDIADPTVLLRIMSVYELALVAWLLSGVYVRYAALLCALTLGGIIFSNFSLFVISFRDAGLLFAALALAVEDYQASRVR